MLGAPSLTPIFRRPTFQTLVISSKFQRRRHPPRPQTNDLEEEFGSMGQIVLKSLKSNPSRKIEPVQVQPEQDSSKRHGWKSKKKMEEEEEETAGLSGSDILLALQRATKERVRSRSGSKGRKKVRRSKGGGGDEGVVDYGDLRDLNIGSDWGVRLDELERLLQQLERF